MKLTLSQQKAVESVDKSVAIIAGAGSGKTEVLTSRLLYLLQEKNLKLSQILCVTFTEKAATEMKRRIAERVDPENKKELPWAAIGTFHSIFLNLLKEAAPLLGLDPEFSVWDEPTAKIEIHHACRQTLLTALEEKKQEACALTEAIDFYHALLLLEELMGFRWHWEQVQKSKSKKQKAKIEEELLEATKILYHEILKNYESEKRRRRALDFQDLEILALQLLQEHPEVLRQLQNRFQHILVDEAQDINDLQQAWLRLLFDPKKNKLCVVGDPKQSIYRFRGANVEGFKKLVASIVEAKGRSIPLNENFRSRPGLLEFINHTFRPLLEPNDYTELCPTRERTGEPTVEKIPIVCDEKATKEKRREQEASVLAHTIRGQVDKTKGRFGDFALLFQSLTEVHHYEEALRVQNIPYRLFGGRGFLSAQEVLDCLFCLKIFNDPQDRLALVGLMRSPFLGLPDTQITQLCLEHSADLLAALLTQPEADWLKNLWEQKTNLSAAEILEKAIWATQYDGILNRLDPSGGKLANLEQLMALVRELEISEGMSLKDLLNWFDTLKKRSAPMAAAPAVDTTLSVCQLMTVHAAKGLEFPVVILPDLFRSPPRDPARTLFVRDKGLGFYLRETETPFSDFVPSETIQQLKEVEHREDLNERKRLLYVAMTRAQEKLVIPFHEGLQTKAPWHQWLQEALATFTPLATISEGGTLPKGSPLPTLPFDKLRVAASPLPWVSLQPQKNDIDGKRYFTVTDLVPDTFLQKQERESSTEELKGASFGNLIHNCLKRIQKLPEISLQQLLQTEAYNLSLIYSEKEIAEAATLLNRFLTSKLAPPNWQGFHELPFRLPLAEAVITGMIDYLYETPSGWVLCDFKTDARFEPEKYALQMDVYALALSKAFEKPVLETRLLFLKPERFHIVPVTAQRLKQTEENLIDFLRALR